MGIWVTVGGRVGQHGGAQGLDVGIAVQVPVGLRVREAAVGKAVVLW